MSIQNLISNPGHQKSIGSAEIYIGELLLCEERATIVVTIKSYRSLVVSMLAY